MPEECQLVDVAKTFPSLHIDLKYATADNITGRPIYQEARCLLHTDAVTALAKAISIATLAGLKLVVYDAYRPQQAQAQLWDACPDPEYVVDVATGSNHSRGTAIDVTLMDEHNTVLDMGAGFDEMHDRSHPYHPSVPPHGPGAGIPRGAQRGDHERSQSRKVSSLYGIERGALWLRTVLCRYPLARRKHG